MEIRNTPVPSLLSQSHPDLWQAWLTEVRQLGLSPTAEQLERIQRFYTLLIEANRTTNLTRITEPEDFLYRSLLDSLALYPLLGSSTGRLMDVGSGAGLPAIPLAIACPDLEVTAVESSGKKAQFMETVKESLGLDNLHIVNQRSETLGRAPEYRQQFDRVTARAVASLPTLLELCLPLVKPGGRFLAMKGLRAEEELAQAKNALHILGGKLETMHRFDLAHLEGSRILEILKQKDTPPQYPRSPGTPGKKPL